MAGGVLPSIEDLPRELHPGCSARVVTTRFPSMKPRSRLSAALALAFAVGFLPGVATFTAQAARLGDPAKPLSLAKTVKGTPVDLAAGKGKQRSVVAAAARQDPGPQTFKHLNRPVLGDDVTEHRDQQNGVGHDQEREQGSHLDVGRFAGCGDQQQHCDVIHRRQRDADTEGRGQPHGIAVRQSAQPLGEVVDQSHATGGNSL